MERGGVGRLSKGGMFSSMTWKRRIESRLEITSNGAFKAGVGSERLA